jgi:hypothetical protein
VLRLPNGAHLDGDEERVYLSFDDEEAGGDGVFVADLVESTGLPEERVRAVLEDLVGQEVLHRSTFVDDTYGPRYLRDRSS